MSDEIKRPANFHPELWDALTREQQQQIVDTVRDPMSAATQAHLDHGLTELDSAVHSECWRSMLRHLREHPDERVSVVDLEQHEAYCREQIIQTLRAMAVSDGDN